MRRASAISLILIGLAVAPAPAVAQPSALEQARQARFAGRIDDAERLLEIVLREEPGNYLALYNMGLVYEARAVRAQAGTARVAHYRTAAQWLEKAYASPGRAAANDYTIYNSLGVMYLGQGDLTSAARYLSQGLKYQGRLEPPSKAKLYSNVGYWHALRGDITQARRFFEAGAKLGSSYSKDSLARLNAAAL